MYDLSKLTDAKKYFADILNEIKTYKIVSVFAETVIYKREHFFEYMQDTPVYIIFDNGKCLAVTYNFINELSIDYREMTVEEKIIYRNELIKDCFNRKTDIYNSVKGKKVGVQKSELSYGSIKSVEFERVIDKYEAWVKGDIVELNPTKETFNTITFIMNNGKSFCICPAEAEADGYSYLWSNDATEMQECF